MKKRAANLLIVAATETNTDEISPPSSSALKEVLCMSMNNQGRPSQRRP